ncbi:enhanced intracellular survival protein Eis [Thermodesulfobacteriota bacterium]
MEIEIRPALQEEMNEARRIAEETNVLPPGLISQAFINGITHDMTLCAFVDGEMATSYASWPFHMKFNGVDTPVAGVSFVGTLPVFRHMGCLRKVHERHFELLHEEKERAISILFASQAAIYQRYGYEVVSTQNSYSIDPRHIQFKSLKHLKSAGKLKQLHGDEVEILDKIYRQFTAPRTGYLIRNKFKWETGVLSPPINSVTVFDKIVYEEDGVPLGYVVYTVDPRHGDSGLPHRISIRDMAWLSISAYYGIWNYFTRMHLAHHINWTPVPVDDPIPHLLLEPGRLNIKSRNGFLARIVDIERAVPCRGYSEDGELIFQIVKDEMCPWNNGTWHMKISNGKGSINKTDKDPEVSMTINSFAMMLFGQITATKAMRMGRLDVMKEDSLTRYDRLLRTEYMPICADII